MDKLAQPSSSPLVRVLFALAGPVGYPTSGQVKTIR